MTLFGKLFNGQKPIESVHTEDDSAHRLSLELPELSSMLTREPLEHLKARIICLHCGDHVIVSPLLDSCNGKNWTVGLEGGYTPRCQSVFRFLVQLQLVGQPYIFVSFPQIRECLAKVQDELESSKLR